MWHIVSIEKCLLICNQTITITTLLHATHNWVGNECRFCSNTLLLAIFERVCILLCMNLYVNRSVCMYLRLFEWVAEWLSDWLAASCHSDQATEQWHVNCLHCQSSVWVKWSMWGIKCIGHEFLWHQSCNNVAVATFRSLYLFHFHFYFHFSFSFLLLDTFVVFSIDFGFRHAGKFYYFSQRALCGSKAR